MNARIVEIWNEVEEGFPDKSTEWLMQYVCDTYQQRHGKEIDHGDVAAALFEDQEGGE